MRPLEALTGSIKPLIIKPAGLDVDPSANSVKNRTDKHWSERYDRGSINLHMRAVRRSGVVRQMRIDDTSEL